MAWNQSTTTEDSNRLTTKRFGTIISRVAIKGVVAASLIAIVAFVAQVFICCPNETAVEKEAIVKAKDKQIEAVFQETVVRTNLPAIKTVRSQEEEIAYLESKYGENMPDGLKARLYFLKHPPKRKFKVKSPFHYFKHHSERQIASLASAKPGAYFLLRPEFGARFNDDFAMASAEPIVVENGDTDDIRLVKESVEALKKEISEICKKEGKTPAQIMTEQADALYELGRYQHDLEIQLNQIEDNPEYSDKDVEDFISAANELLKKKGIEETFNSNLTRRAFRLQKLIDKQSRKAKKKTITHQEI